MTLYDKLFFPVFKKIDAETAHDRTLVALEKAQNSTGGQSVLRRIAGNIPLSPVDAFGLTFPNVLGIAAGFDKDARVAAGLGMLGFGHVEVGTLTPWPQAGNPKPRVFRLPEDQAIINRMGFPNGGVVRALPRLRALAAGEQPLAAGERPFILGVSLGKQKQTPLAEADKDYLLVMHAVYPYADYLAINISSPNTPGLRELQGGSYLAHLLGVLVAENGRLAQKHQIRPRPLLVKIAPDLTWAELDEILDAVQTAGVDGLIATNTTLGRVGLQSAVQEDGGLSGRPLAARSTEIIAYIARQTGSRLPIIGVGGVSTAADVQAKLDAGAKLVQLYTGLVYGGPGIAGRILRHLAAGHQQTTNAA
ncbi:MAG: quinone-dependent dihydroorotate dehydrogenase [Chloroflexi bacterium]|nr:quinone-dependent dihydroorotate dehydrogenase [Chloroflexota bacterium]